MLRTKLRRQLRQRHRVVARTTGRMPQIPAAFRRQVTLLQNDQRLILETSGDLGSLLGWLSELPIRDVSIEPTGLRSIYDEFHASEEAV